MRVILPAMYDLIEHLATFPENGRFQSYTYQRIAGSANNILYRATNEVHDLAVKFTVRDARNRARREFNALLALESCEPDIAPRPVYLNEARYAQPVVVQTWLNGEVTAVPPQTDADWQQLISHYATLSTITPEKVDVDLETAVMSMRSLQGGLDQIQWQLDQIPKLHRPAMLTNLLLALPTSPPSNFPTVSPRALCRIDSNTLNFIRRPGAWASVDWEYSGWGDPAFEIADMMSHPQFMAVSAARWQWVMALYAELTGDETAVIRIQTYYPLMLVWWVARFARSLYEVPRGLDERLAIRPIGWELVAKEKMFAYGRLAEQVLMGKRPFKSK